MLAMRSISLFTAIAILAPLTAQEGVKLRWQFKVGDVLRYRTTIEQSVEMSMMADHTMNNSVVVVLREDVRDVAADGTATIDVGYEAVRIAMDMGSRTSFDSTLTGAEAKQNDPTLAKLIQPLLEAKMHFKLEPDGSVLELAGVKEALAKALQGMESQGAGQMVERLFNADSMHRMLEANVFPDKALTPGESWKRAYDKPTPGLGTLTFAVESKLDGQQELAGRRCEKIAMTTKLTLASDEADDSEEGSMSFRLDDSKVEGTLWFDAERGRIVEYVESMDMKMSMGQESQADSGDEDRLGLNIGLTTTMLLLEKDAPAFEQAGAKAGGAKK